MKRKNSIYYLWLFIFFLSFLFIPLNISLGWGSSKQNKKGLSKTVSNKRSTLKRENLKPTKAKETGRKTLNKFYNHAPSKAKPSEEKTSQSPTLHIYIVKKGDTPQKIAQKFSIPLAELKRANQLKSDRSLKPGQKLLIPQGLNPKVTSVEGLATEVFSEEKNVHLHRISKGETLYGIAKNYQVSVEEIKILNKISEKELKPGMEIKIPLKKEESKKSNIEEPKVQLNNLGNPIFFSGSKVLAQKTGGSSQEEAKVNEGYKYHVVQQGETLYRISLLYNVPIEEIQKINNLEGNLIFVGQKLKIPQSEDTSTQSFVFERPGETLKPKDESLSSKFEKNLLAKNRILTPFMLSKDDEMALKQKFIEISTAYADSRYKLGGDGRGYLDCSSFVKYVFQEFGIKLPRSSAQQFQVGISVDEKELIPGDLVFFRTRGNNISHVGIYIGDNRFIHISSSRKRVAIDSLDDPYFKKRYAGAKRVLNGEVLEYFQDYLQKRELSPGPKLEKDKLSKTTSAQKSNNQEAIF